MNIFESENEIIIENLGHFDLRDTFECGQYLNFGKIGGGGFETVAFGKYLRVYQRENRIYLETSREDFENIWRRFFDLDRDYKKIFDILTRDKTVKKAADFCPGLRILRQDPFECLISFIISQNNNIPRIKKIIAKLCENFGEKIIVGHDDPGVPQIKTDAGSYPRRAEVVAPYKFPTPARLADLTLDDLAVIKSGFRAKYILDAAKKINSGEIDLDLIYNMSADGGAEYLKKINGVGDKVSACVLLFGYNKLDAFPADVWIKKILAKYYPPDFDHKKTFGKYAGLANAYLFYYEREKEKR